MSLLEKKNLLTNIFKVRTPKASRKLAKRRTVKGLRGSHSTAAHLQATSIAHSYNWAFGDPSKAALSSGKEFWQTIEVVGFGLQEIRLPV